METYLLLNGPNLNLLGVREPKVYGFDTLQAIEEEVCAYGHAHGIGIDCFQSNHEGVLIDKLHEARGRYDGIIYNPGAHTHYSYALRDAIASIEVPTVEVHLSDIEAREGFRAVSVMKDVCIAQVKGKGKQGYKEAIDILLRRTRLREPGAGI
ncbi:MAG: type II 3-dehydroquinate dehydratase [Coriobacteriaceae bacterium]|nr:type II 3-dehydroquinate dehydratase [Coriobacteriaceae bacterium]